MNGWIIIRTSGFNCKLIWRIQLHDASLPYCSGRELLVFGPDDTLLLSSRGDYRLYAVELVDKDDRQYQPGTIDTDENNDGDGRDARNNNL